MLEYVIYIFGTETDTCVPITGEYSARTSSENAIHFRSEGNDTADVSFTRLSDVQFSPLTDWVVGGGGGHEG